MEEKESKKEEVIQLMDKMDPKRRGCFCHGRIKRSKRGCTKKLSPFRQP